MEVMSSTPEAVGIRVALRKPLSSTSDVVFVLEPRGAATEVSWTMTGEQSGVAAVLGRLVPMDRLIGKDFERGLAQLKAVAEA